MSGATKSGVAETTHRRDIEGLRAIAVSLVILYHFGIGGVGGGYVGVDVFFVVSGFLITSSLLNEVSRNGSFRLRDFYARRIRRLLPISAVVLACTALASAIVLDPSRLRNTGIDIIGSGLFSSNWIFANRATDYLQGALAPSPVQHYWSLSLEEQFYLLWPLLLLVGVTIDRRLKRRFVAIALITTIVCASFGVSVALTKTHPTWSYFGLHSRAWELGVGALVAVGARHIRIVKATSAAVIGVVALGAIVASGFLFAPPIVFPGWIASVPVVSTALLIVTGSRASNPTAVVLGNPVLHFVGARSYSLYLWHWPVLILFEAKFGTSLTGLQTACALLVTFVLTETGYRLIENPVRFSPTFVASIVRTMWLGLVSVAAVAGAGLVLSRYDKVITTGYRADAVSTESGDIDEKILAVRTALRSSLNPSPLPDNLDPSLAELARAEFSPGLGNCFGRGSNITIEDCEFGDLDGSLSIALFGDSHMAQWFSVFDGMAKSSEYRLRTYVHAGCSIAGVTTLNPLTNQSGPWCVDWVGAALDDMQRRDIDYVVMTNNFFLFDASTRQPISAETWTVGMKNTVDRVVSMGITPILLADNPRPRGDLRQCLLRNSNDISQCSVVRAQNTRAELSISGRQIMSFSNGLFLDLADYMCVENQCPAVAGNILMYSDSSHLSTEGTRLLAPVVTTLVSNFISSHAN